MNVPISSISLTVPNLPDNDVAFANNAAWVAYWKQANFSANVPAADVGVYGVVQKASTTIYTDPGTTATNYVLMTIGNVQYQVALAASFDELKAQVTALNATVKQMKSALAAAGIITNA